MGHFIITGLPHVVLAFSEHHLINHFLTTVSCD